jgi:hypothetical protein
VPRDSDSRKTTLARAARIYKSRLVLSPERVLYYKNKTLAVKK